MILFRWIKTLVRDVNQRRLFNRLFQYQTVLLSYNPKNDLFKTYINNLINGKTIYTDLIISELMNEVKSSKHDILTLDYTMNKRHFGGRVQNLSHTLFDLKYRLYDISSISKSRNTNSIRFVYILEGSEVETNIQKHFFTSKESI
jgi:hypothetical protein